MPLEAGTTIQQLDQNWPLGSDTATRGDDHLRLIKLVLKKQFPGVSGSGFAKPITTTEDVLNNIATQNKAFTDEIAQIKLDIASIQDNAIEKFYPIGHMIITVHADSPDSYGYPGSWQNLGGDMTLMASLTNVGNISGENNPLVPLPDHAHNMAHTHSRGSMQISGSIDIGGARGGTVTGAFTSRGYNYSNPSGGGHGEPGGGSPSLPEPPHEEVPGSMPHTYVPELRNTSGASGVVATFTASRAWSGVTSQPNTPNTGRAGAVGARLDVTGKHMRVYVWKRIS